MDQSVEHCLGEIIPTRVDHEALGGDITHIYIRLVWMRWLFQVIYIIYT